MFPLPNVSQSSSSASSSSGSASWGPNGIEFPGYFSGQRFNSVVYGGINSGLTSGISAFTVAADTFTLFPFFIIKDTAIDRIGVLEVAGGSAQNHKIGVYGANRQLIDDVGVITSAASIGIREVVYSKNFTKGLYYMGLKSSAAQTFAGHIVNSTIASGGVVPTKNLFTDLVSTATAPSGIATLNDVLWQGTDTYANAMPLLVPALTTSTSDDSTPTVFFRAL